MVQNRGIIGDDSEPNFDLPNDNLSQELAFAELQKTARFSKSAEYKELSDYWDKRIQFYQTWLPNGDPVEGEKMNNGLLGERWRVANAVIREFIAMKAVYETAAEAVKEEIKRRKP